MPRIRNNIPLRLNLQRVRREFRGQQGTYRTTFLAAVNGAVRVPGGFFWVHDLASADSSGNATYGAPYQLPIEPGAAIDPKPDFAVRVIKINGQEYVHGMSPGELQRAGYDMHQTNVLDPSRKYVALAQISDMQAFPRGDDTVRVEPVLYEKQDGTYAIYSAGAMSPYIDLLTAYTPADEDDSTIVCVWLDTHDNVAATTQSSEFERSPTIIYTPSEALPFINEAAVLRPADAMGVRCFLVNGDTTVMDMTNSFHDLRPFFHSPPGMGVDNPVTRHTRVWAGREWQHRGLLKIEALLEIKGRLTIYGDATGGAGSGGAPTDATYLLQVADGDLPNAQAMGALATGIVKNTTTTGVQSIAVAGTDYMQSFDVAADTGTPATIEDSDELEIAGDGLNTETSIAAKVVTIALKQEAVVKVCDLRMSNDVELPYYALNTDVAELVFAPIKSGMVTLPVSGLWRYFEVAGITTPIEAANTETGDVASGSAVITNMSYTRSLAPGMTISGTGINAAATIVTVDSATQITMSHTGTATNAGVTLTFEFPADTTYDVFLVYDSGLATVVPFYRKWQSSSLRSAMTQVNGIWLSDDDTDARWIGAIRVPTNQLFQKNALQCYVSNLDHPFPHPMRVTDNEDSWTYGAGDWRQARATAANKVEFIAAMWNFTYSFSLVAYASGVSGRIGYAGIGLNSTSAPAAGSYGRQGNWNSSAQEFAVVILEGDATAGHNSIVWLEKAIGGSLFFYGDNAQTNGMQSGLSGTIMA